jgi:DNA-binding GntR family transcriptional regulator
MTSARTATAETAPRRRGRRSVHFQIDLKPVFRETVVDRVYAQLRDLVIRGQLRPGVTYTIRGLARAVGTSAMPIRSVLHMLVAEGALEVLPNRSVRVPLVSADRYAELCEIRAALEGLAATMAVQKAPAGLVVQLEAINAEYVKAMARSDRQRIFDANRQFHFTLYAHSGAPALMRLIETVWLLTGPYVNVTFANQPASSKAESNHARVIRAVSRREPERCRAAIETDIRDACRFTIKELHRQAATS